jgi:hypothetical protein
MSLLTCLLFLTPQHARYTLFAWQFECPSRISHCSRPTKPLRLSTAAESRVSSESQGLDWFVGRGYMMAKSCVQWCDRQIDCPQGRTLIRVLPARNETVMLPTELHARDIPHIYDSFAEVVGERHWRQRVSLLRQEIRGNRFLAQLHTKENAIAFQLEHLAHLRERYPGRIHDRWHYALVTLASCSAASDALATNGQLIDARPRRGRALDRKTADARPHGGHDGRTPWPKVPHCSGPCAITSAINACGRAEKTKAF